MKLKDEFKEVQVEHIDRDHNERADEFARIASDRKSDLLRTLIQKALLESSIHSKECMNISLEDKEWRVNIVDYLTKDNLPENSLKAKVLRTQAARYAMISEDLYRRGFSALLLKCLTRGHAKYEIRELHKGICGMHSRSQTMETKILRAGYYWPTLRIDCVEYVKRCIQC